MAMKNAEIRLPHVSKPVRPSQLRVLFRRARGGEGIVMGFPSCGSIRLSRSILDN